MAAIAGLDILIVDDHEAMRAILERSLSRAGAQKIRQAAAGPQALELLAERPADLILADHRMPGMDGHAFIAAVRADDALSHARILMITGSSEACVAAAARAAGADAVLVKPVAPSALMGAIAALYA
ncbi:MAG: response regulator [Hyphomonadaceae bacterium]